MTLTTGGDTKQVMTFADVARHTGYLGEADHEPLVGYITGAVNWAYHTKRISHPVPECGYWIVGSPELEEVLAFFRFILSHITEDPTRMKRTKRKKTRRPKRDRRKYVPPPPKPLTLKERIMAKKKATKTEDTQVTTGIIEGTEETEETVDAPPPGPPMVKLIDLAGEVGMGGQEARRHLRIARDEGRIEHNERSRWEWEEGSDNLEAARAVLIEGKNAPKTRKKKEGSEATVTAAGAAAEADAAETDEDLELETEEEMDLEEEEE